MNKIDKIDKLKKRVAYLERELAENIYSSSQDIDNMEVIEEIAWEIKKGKSETTLELFAENIIRVFDPCVWNECEIEAILKRVKDENSFLTKMGMELQKIK